jgi:hypothetical protein
MDSLGCNQSTQLVGPLWVAPRCLRDRDVSRTLQFIWPHLLSPVVDEKPRHREPKLYELH